MLLRNGLSSNAIPLTLVGYHWSNFVREDSHLLKATGILGAKAAIPSGYGMKAFSPPMKAGAINSHRYTAGTSTATLSMASGWNIAGLAEGSTPTAAATLQLVVSMLASAAGEATGTANIRAALGMAGSAEGSSTSGALISALAWAIGSASGEATAALVSYATGQLQGSITPYTELSPESLAASVWNSLTTAYQEAGTMGNALSTASSGGVDYGTLADAVRTELGIELDAILEVWRRHGLDITAPLTQTATSITAGDIDLAITGDPDVSVTVTRQP